MVEPGVHEPSQSSMLLWGRFLIGLITLFGPAFLAMMSLQKTAYNRVSRGLTTIKAQVNAMVRKAESMDSLEDQFDVLTTLANQRKRLEEDKELCDTWQQFRCIMGRLLSAFLVCEFYFMAVDGLICRFVQKPLVLVGIATLSVILAVLGLWRAYRVLRLAMGEGSLEGHRGTSPDKISPKPKDSSHSITTAQEGASI